MQNAGIAALGLNWRYLAFDVHPTELRQVIAGAKAMKFIGLNLTLPHKLLALDLVDELDESARAWGAVNTIRLEGRGENGDWAPLGEVAPEQITEVRSQGFNTDADALVRALAEDLGCNLRAASVLVLGAGGAGRVAALKLAAEGVANIFLVNRTEEKSEAIGREIRQRYPETSVKVGYPEATVDLIVNATSLGLKDVDPLPHDAKRFPLGKARNVYDMIYRPAETKLLKAAKAAGCGTANGLGMLLYQGTKALEIWTGQPAPEEVMKKALEENIYG
jgi:shikimate dehydrogenase